MKAQIALVAYFLCSSSREVSTALAAPIASISFISHPLSLCHVQRVTCGQGPFQEQESGAKAQIVSAIALTLLSMASQSEQENRHRDISLPSQFGQIARLPSASASGNWSINRFRSLNRSVRCGQWRKSPRRLRRKTTENDPQGRYVPIKRSAAPRHKRGISSSKPSTGRRSAMHHEGVAANRTAVG